MKTLKTHIADLKQQISTANVTALPKLQVALAEELCFVNSTEQTQLIESFLASPGVDVESVEYKEMVFLKGTYLLYQSNTDEAGKIFEALLFDAVVSQHPKLLCEVKQSAALNFQQQGKRDEANQQIEQVIELATRLNLPEVLCHAYVAACFVASDKDLSLSGEYGLKGLHYAKLSGRKWLEGFALTTLGWWATWSKREEESLEYFTSSAKILKSEGADEYLAITLDSLSQRQKDLLLFDEALINAYEAKNIFEKNGMARMNISSHYSIARIYRAQKKYDEALFWFQSALKLAQHHNIVYEIGMTYGYMAFLYRDIEKYEEAIACFKKAEACWGETIKENIKADLHKQLHSLYYKTNKLDSAYQSLLTYSNIRFQLLDENRAKESARLQNLYETEKREAELREIKLQQAQSELKAIKAQMNPHFIFNALNSIQEMFFIGDKRLANEHLGKFSQLTREILKASGKQFITLTEEIEMLKKYLELEGLRFETDFSFTISVNDENAADDIFLPPMLIQPYIENSIRHGLLHKKGEKKINVNFNFNEEKKLLTCIVNDNGIGRAASAKINKNRKQLHESFSTLANAKRLELLNQNREEKIGVVYHDLQEGTGVEITIPIHYD